MGRPRHPTLFTQVRGSGILRTSENPQNANFAYHDFCELRVDGGLGSSSLAAAVCTPGLYLPVGMDAALRQRTMVPWAT
jgi:hypothetical protein